MNTYSLSKMMEIVISRTFAKSDTVTIKKLTYNMLIVLNPEDTLKATSDGQYIRRTVIRLLEDLQSKKGKEKVSSTQLLKIANGIAHREWVACIMTFHIVLAMCIITNYTSKLLESYTNEEIMFSPLVNQYGMHDSIVDTALSRPVYVNESKVDRIASALAIHSSITIRGPAGVGKKTLILALVKQIVLGKYPLLYNSVILINPTRTTIDSHSVEQFGSHIICVMTRQSPEDVVPPSASMTGIELSRRLKFIYVNDTNEQPMIPMPPSPVSKVTIDIPPPDDNEILEIVKALLVELKSYIDFTMDTDEIVPYLIRAADRFEGSSVQPSKSVNMMTELILSKLNTTVLGEKKHKVPTSVLESDKKECESILEQLKSNTALSILKSSAAHIHICIKDAENFIVKRFNLTREILASMLSTNVREHLRDLKGKLAERVYGQDEALDDVVKSLWRRALRLDRMEKPISFMLIGFTGTGKTFITKKLAELMYGSESKMVRFDMSEYMERHEVSKLIGSPPGYIGSNQPGRLTEAVSKNPYAILLFDEVEKAHQDVMNIFLQILDDGRLTDNQGKTTDFSKTIIIMTSNVGCDIAYSEKAPIGFSYGSDNYLVKKQKETIRKATETHFRPEFINRIDKIIVVNELGDKEFVKIIQTRLEEIKESSILNIKYDKKVPATILKIARSKKYDIRKYNAREVKRVIVDHVENRIVDFMMDNDAKNVQIRSEDGKVKITKK